MIGCLETVKLSLSKCFPWIFKSSRDQNLTFDYDEIDRLEFSDVYRVTPTLFFRDHHHNNSSSSSSYSPNRNFPYISDDISIITDSVNNDISSNYTYTYNGMNDISPLSNNINVASTITENNGVNLFGDTENDNLLSNSNSDYSLKRKTLWKTFLNWLKDAITSQPYDRLYSEYSPILESSIEHYTINDNSHTSSFFLHNGDNNQSVQLPVSRNENYLNYNRPTPNVPDSQRKVTKNKNIVNIVDNVHNQSTNSNVNSINLLLNYEDDAKELDDETINKLLSDKVSSNKKDLTNKIESNSDFGNEGKSTQNIT